MFLHKALPALGLVALSGFARAEGPHVVAPADAYPRIVERRGQICEEDLDEHGCLLHRCRSTGQRRDPGAPGSIVGASPRAEQPELCKVGESVPMPRHAEPAIVEAPPVEARGGPPSSGERLRFVSDERVTPRYVEGNEHDALFRARTEAATGAAQGWSLPFKFVAVGSAVALPFLVADAAVTGSAQGGNASGLIAPIVVDVLVGGLCAAVAVIIDSASKRAVEAEAKDAELPGAQPAE